MINKSQEENKSRFLIHNGIGSYPPWNGYKSTDLLNGNDYLLFSLQLPNSISISLADLEMRSVLFASINREILQILSIEKDERKIIFLLPDSKYQPLTDHLVKASNEKSFELLKYQFNFFSNITNFCTNIGLN